MQIVYFNEFGKIKVFEAEQESLLIYDFVFTEKHLVIGLIYDGVFCTSTDLTIYENYLCMSQNKDFNLLHQSYMQSMGRHLVIDLNNLKPVCCDCAIELPFIGNILIMIDGQPAPDGTPISVFNSYQGSSYDHILSEETKNGYINMPGLVEHVQNHQYGTGGGISVFIMSSMSSSLDDIDNGYSLTSSPYLYDVSDSRLKDGVYTPTFDRS